MLFEKLKVSKVCNGPFSGSWERDQRPPEDASPLLAPLEVEVADLSYSDLFSRSPAQGGGELASLLPIPREGGTAFGCHQSPGGHRRERSLDQV